jgi:hypothetical protein
LLAVGCIIVCMTKQAKTEHLTLRLDPALRAALDAAAQERQRSAGSLVRLILSDWLASRERAVKAAARDALREGAAA